MARFRAPSTSVASIGSAPARNIRSQGANPQKLRATSRRARAHKLEKAKKGAAYKPKTVLGACTVYVGNIAPEVDEDALRAHFGGCGKILSATIHCCGGVAMSVKPPPGYYKDKPVRQFAIIVFETKQAKFDACRLGGTLGGQKLAISVAISDLPEVQEKITKRLEDYRAMFRPPDRRQGALQSLRLEPTEIIENQNVRQSRLAELLEYLGLKLPLTIM